MKIKLDENLGRRAAEIFLNAGHDVETVASERLSGATDRELIEICRREGRCLVTLDLDFSNPLVFTPSDYAGIAVLRLPHRATDTDLWAACEVLVRGIRIAPLVGRLWIVHRGIIREYRPEPDGS
jgi:predicted nuclease of predicted toxin-antitoxin system